MRAAEQAQVVELPTRQLAEQRLLRSQFQSRIGVDRRGRSLRRALGASLGYAVEAPVELACGVSIGREVDVLAGRGLNSRLAYCFNVIRRAEFLKLGLRPLKS